MVLCAGVCNLIFKETLLLRNNTIQNECETVRGLVSIHRGEDILVALSAFGLIRCVTCVVKRAYVDLTPAT